MDALRGGAESFSKLLFWQQDGTQRCAMSMTTGTELGKNQSKSLIKTYLV